MGKASEEFFEEITESEVGKSTLSLRDELSEDLLFTSEKPVSKQLALIVWEDITAYSRVEIPEDFERYRLIKKTAGFIWSETPEYLVLVQDYDLTNRGKNFRHNDFHIIPKGIIKKIKYLGEEDV